MHSTAQLTVDDAPGVSLFCCCLVFGDEACRALASPFAFNKDGEGCLAAGRVIPERRRHHFRFHLDSFILVEVIFVRREGWRRSCCCCCLLRNDFLDRPLGLWGCLGFGAGWRCFGGRFGAPRVGGLGCGGSVGVGVFRGWSLAVLPLPNITRARRVFPVGHKATVEEACAAQHSTAEPWHATGSKQHTKHTSA